MSIGPRLRCIPYVCNRADQVSHHVSTDECAAVAIPDFEWSLIDKVSNSAAGVIVSGAYRVPRAACSDTMEPIAALRIGEAGGAL